mmetsp:Transcript_19222/g.42637  ORF Transcript_19222/g.42637 Transcript_19222/m.42637 type:complete len:695 (-) Transcript_19222:241-2325(-)|eukprot:CAMPEP_0204331454 /NCGR_PEP_ID=MMETSP0469-20131031/15713_1 /ASSEMBLY_ACC=CAM_ASM_000384 /TAXON_ID=2969 /ORGANISM="Oxyrrhis marina" /LENGTH=694 /DNA_ID=CAMNT_0051314461 /DNA_START=10 /DNA_END=2094 /DNA_ORIENTATION=-
MANSAAGLGDAVESFLDVLEDVVGQPEQLLQQEAEGIHVRSLEFAKACFAALHSQAPDAGLPQLLTDGFTIEQMWAQLQRQNHPLTKKLNRQVDEALAAHESGELKVAEDVKPLPDAPDMDDLGLDDDAADIAPTKKKTKGAKKMKTTAKARPKKSPIDSLNFNVDDLEKFLVEAEEAEAAGNPGGVSLQTESEDEEDSDVGRDYGKKAKHSDFFDPDDGDAEQEGVPLLEDGDQTDTGGEDGGEEQSGHAEENTFGLPSALDDDASDEEKDLEAALDEAEKQAEAEEQEEDDDEGEDSDADDDPDQDPSEDDEDAIERAEQEQIAAEMRKEARAAGHKDAAPVVEDESLSKKDARIKALQEEISQLEAEQLDEKHWSLVGEVGAKDRPLNSLLELHVDLPQSSYAAKRAENDADKLGLSAEDAGVAGVETDNVPLEAIIIQRIEDKMFDDVIATKKVRPADEKQGSDDPFAGLDFTKSRVGLGEIYAAQYEEQVLGKPLEQEEDVQKKEAKKLFLELMYKLDRLSNNFFTPKVPKSALFDGKSAGKARAVVVEDKMPVHVSDAVLKAPEEVKPPDGRDKADNELTREERTAQRRQRKHQRIRATLKRVQEGDLTLSGLEERATKLREKNKLAKQAVRDQKAGVDRKAGKKTKIKSTELLAMAGEAANADLTRKQAMRQQRLDSNTMSSKKAKL